VHLWGLAESAGKSRQRVGGASPLQGNGFLWLKENMNMLYNSCLDILCSAIFIYIGFLILKHRNKIGAFTDYYVGHGRWVDKSTPGWMLIPFALVFIVIGIFGVYSIFNPGPTYVPYHSLPHIREFPVDLLK
jgi:hypothetical protein